MYIYKKNYFFSFNNNFLNISFAKILGINLICSYNLKSKDFAELSEGFLKPLIEIFVKKV